AEVLTSVEAVGLKCVYPGGSAFGPAGGAAWHVAGWVTGDDASMRPDLKPRTRRVEACQLGGLVKRACEDVFASPVAWVAPVHHWATELDHDSGDWLPAWLRGVGVQPNELKHADAVAMDVGDDGFAGSLDTLIQELGKTDFALLIPGSAVVGMLHHHVQVWWRTAAEDVAAKLMALADAET
ncbi:MAG: hypothetical protein AAGK78_03590, partial [Planctomycetota bacterium]